MNHAEKIEDAKLDDTKSARRDDQAAHRTTANADGSFVVFLIGMRINRWWRPDQWVPVIGAMGRMIRELRTRPELGLLGLTATGLSNPLVLVQYWRSIEQLQAFATGRDGLHLPAWKAFNARARATQAVGVWRETYVMRPGNHESVYINMPPFGLGAAFGVLPATGARSTAHGRLAAPNEARLR